MIRGLIITAAASIVAAGRSAGTRRAYAVQPHQLSHGDGDRAGKARQCRDARLVPHRSRAMPPGSRRPARCRHGLCARAHAAGLWQRAAAARRPGRILRPRRRLRHCRSRAAARQASRRISARRSRRIQPKGPIVNLAEEADYDDAQARLAGIQRLLAIAGYDAYPIDGVQGAKTQAAIAKFLGRPQAGRGRRIGTGNFSTP